MSGSGHGRRAKHAGHEEEHENHERWLVSYADLITLLFALFIMLYAMSILDLKKFQAFREAVNEGTGKAVQALPSTGDPPDGLPNDERPGTPDGAEVPSPQPVTPDQGQPPVADAAKLQELKDKLEAEIARAGITGSVSVEVQRRGVDVSVTSGVLFASGRADLLPAGRDVLAKLAPVLSTVGNDLVVEGHTDNVPVTGAYGDNWGLSTARATSVLRFVAGAAPIAPARLSASGHADTRPVAGNDSDEHRAHNRRVEIIVLAPPAPDPAPAASATAPVAAPVPGATAAPAAEPKH